MGAVRYRWSGQILDTIDYAAFIGRSPGSDRVFVATGDSGQGITHGVVAGMLLGDLIDSDDHPWAPVYDPSRRPPKSIGNFLGGTIDVFDRAFQPVVLGADAFHDPRLPEGYAPFNVQAIGGSLYVAYARREAGSIDEVAGPGHGFVDVYSPAGVLQRRLQWGAWFNAPWGVALAPADFGRFGGMILVGQFGSGKIVAFDPATGRFRGMLRGDTGRPLRIEGLWGLGFGNGAGSGPAGTLYFTAGIEDEAHGLYGSLAPMPRGDHHEEEDDEDDDND